MNVVVVQVSFEHLFFTYRFRSYSDSFSVGNGKDVFTEMDDYTCLSILLATFSYRTRGTFGLRTLYYLLNGVANAW